MTGKHLGLLCMHAYIVALWHVVVEQMFRWRKSYVTE